MVRQDQGIVQIGQCGSAANRVASKPSRAEPRLVTTDPRYVPAAETFVQVVARAAAMWDRRPEPTLLHEKLLERRRDRPSKVCLQRRASNHPHAHRLSRWRYRSAGRLTALDSAGSRILVTPTNEDPTMSQNNIQFQHLRSLTRGPIRKRGTVRGRPSAELHCEPFSSWCSLTDAAEKAGLVGAD